MFRSDNTAYTILIWLIIIVPLVCPAWSAESVFTSVSNDSLEAARQFIDPWFSRDKGLHLVGSLMTTVAISKSLQRFGNASAGRATYWGIGFSFSLGLGKEIYDHRKPFNRFSFKDLTADIAGIVIGSIIVSIP